MSSLYLYLYTVRGIRAYNMPARFLRNELPSLLRLFALVLGGGRERKGGGAAPAPPSSAKAISEANFKNYGRRLHKFCFLPADPTASYFLVPRLRIAPLASRPLIAPFSRYFRRRRVASVDKGGHLAARPRRFGRPASAFRSGRASFARPRSTRCGRGPP